MDGTDSMRRLVSRAYILRSLARSVSTPGEGDASQVLAAVAALAAGAPGSSVEPGPASADAPGPGPRAADEWPDVPAALVEAARAAWLAWELGSARREYTRLFCGKVLASPNEASYGDGRRPAGRARELADISGFYTAFGFGPAVRGAQLFDHIAVELEFVSLMLLKQAYALDLQDREAYEISAAATRAFLQEHLGRWVPAFCAQCLDHEPAPPLAAALALIERVVAEECRICGAAPVLLSGRIEPETEDGAFECPRSSTAIH